MGLGTTREAGQAPDIDPRLVEIRPEPSPAERAAILLALEQMLPATRNDAAPPIAWALAGRREARAGRDSSSWTGWGRGSDRLAGW